MDKTKKVTFKGKVIRNVYSSESFKTYAVDFDQRKYPNVKKNKYGNASIIGELPDLTLGVEYEIIAEEQHSKYGISYRVINIRRDAPKNREDVLVFLEEILTDNQARVLYDSYPDIIDRIKANKLEDIDLEKLHGIGEKTFNRIKNKIVETFELADLVVEFKGILSLSVIKKIYDKYSSIEVLKTKLKSEPYTTLTKISGIGFKVADSITLQLQKDEIIDFGYDVKTSVDRCLSCLIYLLQENESEGHTKMNLADLRRQCMELVPECFNHFSEAMQSASIYYNKDTMDVALMQTYNTEKYIAETIVANIDNPNNVWDFDINKYRNVGEFDLSDEQMQAIDNVCKHNISILNGFAGSGKSFSTKALINMLDDNNKIYHIFAPTGKASKVISDFTGRRASTIHRGLGYMPPGQWEFNKDQKLFSDIVIIDEFSMCDINLFKHVVDAIDFNTTKLMLIGDNAQLPSVSCGNLLHDFLESDIIPTATLTKIFRYGDGGLMKAATDTRCCKTFLDQSMQGKATTFGLNKDYTFIDTGSDAIPSCAVALYKKLIDQGNKPEDIQVLTAKNVGDCGTIVLNNSVQKIANPNYGSGEFMKVGDTTYYVGDLVLEKVNNYKAELVPDENDMPFYDDDNQTAFVANGETGIIEEVHSTYVIINFDGVRVKYYRDNMNMIGLGYAMSIHKSQGSGIDNVILCTPKNHIFMLNSNLIYVGLTRTKKRCYHFGNISTINQAVAKKENLARHTFMQQLLLENK